MALSIKTEEADRLARELSRLTGETMSEAVTQALRERLEGLRRKQAADEDIVARVQSFARSISERYDRRPITQAEWDSACGDTADGAVR